MNGLIRKELTLLTSSYKGNVLFVVALYVILCIATRQSYIGYVLPFVFTIYITSTVAFDENSHWNTYARTLPVTPAQLVGCKYLLGLGGMLLGSAIAAVIACLVNLLAPEEPTTAVEMIIMLLLMGSFALLFVSVKFPLAYRFNATVVNGWMGLGLLLIFGIGMLGYYLLPDVQQTALVQSLQGADDAALLVLGAGLFILMLVIYAASFALSTAIYKHKSF